MPPIIVAEFVWDDDNREKIARHGLYPDQVNQVLDEEYIVARNRQNRRAPYLMIGLDYGGQCIAIPIVPTVEPTVWRPVTAWRCKPSERVRLTQQRRR